MEKLVGKKMVLALTVTALMVMLFAFQNFATVPTGPAGVPVAKVSAEDCPYTAPEKPLAFHHNK